MEATINRHYLYCIPYYSRRMVEEHSKCKSENIQNKLPDLLSEGISPISIYALNVLLTYVNAL